MFSKFPYRPLSKKKSNPTLLKTTEQRINIYIMGNITKRKHTIGLFGALCLLFLTAALLTLPAAAPKKHVKPQDVAQSKGYPDTASLKLGPKAIALATPPTNYTGDPPPPDYDPANVGFNAGMTGLVTISNTNGVHYIDPRTKRISPLFLGGTIPETPWIDPDHPEDPPVMVKVGKLGSEGGGRFDVAMSRDGRLAAISNFGDSTVYFVQLKAGEPEVLGHVQIDFFAEDMDFTPDGKWLLVTDGGSSSVIARIHVPTRRWIPHETEMVDDDSDPITPDVEVGHSWSIPEVEIPNPSYDPSDPTSPETITFQPDAQSIDISSDGRTVVVVDYFGNRVHILLLDPATGDLTYRQTFTLERYFPANEWISGNPVKTNLKYWPVNATISPNGRTVLVTNPHSYWDEDEPLEEDDPKEGANMAVFYIDSPGHAIRKPDVIMPRPASSDPDIIAQNLEYWYSGEQSVVFSRDGSRAYTQTLYPYKYWDTTLEPDDWMIGLATEVHELIVSGGSVTHGRSVRLPSPRGNSQLFGVDTMATSPDGNFLWLTNPTLSGGRQTIDVVNVRSMTLAKQIGTMSDVLDPMYDPADENMLGAPLIPTGIAFPETPIYLSLETMDVPAKAAIDETFTFKVLVKNNNIGYACGIHINSLLPEGIELVSATTNAGEWKADEGLWYLGELLRLSNSDPEEDHATLTVTVKGTTLGAKAFQYWINKQAGYDPNHRDDEALFTVKIVDKTDLGITAQASSLTPVINAPFTITLTAQNLGPSPAVNVSVTEALPSTWTVQSSAPGAGSYDAASGTWSIGPLAVNGSATLQLTIVASALGQTSLEFPISDTDTMDIVPGNDTAPLTLEIVKVGPPMNVAVTRFENDLIFKKEWVNKLTWQHNTVNGGVSAYRILRKIKGAADSSYALLVNVNGSLNMYADRGLAASQLFTYQITAVNSQGEESPGVVVGN